MYQLNVKRYLTCFHYYLLQDLQGRTVKTDGTLLWDHHMYTWFHESI